MLARLVMSLDRRYSKGLKTKSRYRCFDQEEKNMADQLNPENLETQESSGLLLSVEPLNEVKPLMASPSDDSDAADTGDGSDAIGIDADGTDAADADGTDKTDSEESDGTDSVDKVGDTDGTDSSDDSDGSDS